MFHLELRQFPHVARVFNLTREEVDARFARPWVNGTVIKYEDQPFAPDRGHLTIYEGPELRPDEIAMGRGWGNVGKSSQEVTETVLTEAARGAQASSTVQTFKAAVRTVAERAPITFKDVATMAASAYPKWRASEQLALAEQAVWEMLHQRTLILTGADGPVDSSRWQPIVMSWSTWAGDGPAALTLTATSGD